jgi:hypothetical protein
MARLVSSLPCSPVHWRGLYMAAIFEIDSAKLPARIAAAEESIRQRTRELFQTADDHGDEDQDLDDATYVLHALRSASQPARDSDYYEAAG